MEFVEKHGSVRIACPELDKQSDSDSMEAIQFNLAAIDGDMEAQRKLRRNPLIISRRRMHDRRETVFTEDRRVTVVNHNQMPDAKNGRTKRLRFTSDHNQTGHASINSQQVRSHVDDLMLTMPWSWIEIVHTIGLESDRAINKAVLILPRVVPEGIAVPEGDVCRILERSATVGTRRL